MKKRIYKKNIKKQNRLNKIIKDYINENHYMRYDLFDLPISRIVEVKKPTVKLYCNVEKTELEKEYFGDKFNELLLNEIAHGISKSDKFKNLITIEKETFDDKMYNDLKTVYHGEIEILVNEDRGKYHINNWNYVTKK